MEDLDNEKKIKFYREELNFYKKRLKVCKNKIIGAGIFCIASDGIMALLMINDIESNYMGLAISGFCVVSSGTILFILNELMKYLKNSYNYEDVNEKMMMIKRM